MNIILISECTKNAAIETCRIIDQFAERFGNRTWQTQITQQGLETLRLLLKRTARKNTAVACHWVRGRSRVELLWIVGNSKKFSHKGTVPTNTTQKNILRSHDENNWNTLHIIQILAAIAALFHDFGKASCAFQLKLKNGRKSRNPIDAYRHEWVSLRLFEVFVNNADEDKAWLEKLANLDNNYHDGFEKNLIGLLIKDGVSKKLTDPFVKMPPLAKVIGWLILTHHRLPRRENPTTHDLSNLLNKLGPDYGYQHNHSEEKYKNHCWEFKKGLPFASKNWRIKANFWGNEALKNKDLINKNNNWIENLYTLHLARMSLILADHWYSQQPANIKLGQSNFPLYANTDKEGNLKQRLDEHLIGVAKNAKYIAKSLPLLEKSLNHLPPNLRIFKQRCKDERFRWQDKAYDLACSLREKSNENGFFGINMASTGCGKTFANGRIMYGLAHQSHGGRFSIALGLRILTLQTGQAYRERLNLGDDDLAVLVGSAAVKKLFESSTNPDENTLNEEQPIVFGSESSESLEPDNSYVDFNGSPETGSIHKWIKNDGNLQKIISAPILVCTIDHLIGATEGTRGGKQIAPMLRLLTSDLILDEPDDFDMDDLPALTRLVHWAGLLGSKILLSSATLPPALIEGLFEAYKNGRAQFQKARGKTGLPINICCAWFDENEATSSDHNDLENFSIANKKFIETRIKKLQLSEIRRYTKIQPLSISSTNSDSIYQELGDQIQEMIYDLHNQHHTVDPVSGKKVSFGLVRFANIDPLIDFSKYIIKQNTKHDHHIRFFCYHSRYPLLIRNSIEQTLDSYLRRTCSNNIFFKNQELQNIFSSVKEKNIIFIVFASPVAEVGRDHDYDWGIVEPSSMRSIIQLLGRIKRHRFEICSAPNVYLLNTNIRSLKDPNHVTYDKPGFENINFRLQRKNLTEILLPEQYEISNSIPRLHERHDLNPENNLIDLEHARLQALMHDKYPERQDKCPVKLWWESQATLSASLQTIQKFRSGPPTERVSLMIDDEANLKYFNIEDAQPIPIGNEIKIMDHIELGTGVQPWKNFNYLEMLSFWAEKEERSLEYSAKKYGYIDLPKETHRIWQYQHSLGLQRQTQK